MEVKSGGRQPLVARLLSSLPRMGQVADVRVGIHWTAVVVETENGLRAGLASTQVARAVDHGRPMVAEAGCLVGRDAVGLAALATSDSPTERSIGFATINALLEVDESACTDGNAEDIVVAQGRDRRVAIVGHFPFVPRARQAAQVCWVLELEPGPGDLPAAMAPDILPQADVVAITAMTLLNGTFDDLIALCAPGAFVLVLGPTTPLSPILFDYGASAISGTLVLDIPAVVAAVSQGATFRQVPGRRLVTMTRDHARRRPAAI